MPYPDKINNLVSVTGDQTLAAGGHAARHNDVNEALVEVKGALGGGDPVVAQSASTTPLVLKGASGQTANLLTVEDSAGTDLVVVDEAGKVGIGIDPTNPLTVSTGGSFPATSSQAFQGVFQNGTHAGISILSGNAHNGWVLFGDTDNTSAGGINYSHVTNGFVFRINNATRVTFDSTGAIIPNGGVYLGGTAAANQLDDYEEGTWTPEIADATTGGNVGSPSVSIGRYTKIGQLVHVVCRIDNIDTTGMTSGNTLYIRGLPFTSTGSYGHPGSATFNRVTWANDGVPVPIIAAASTHFLFFSMDNGTGNATSQTVGSLYLNESDFSVVLIYIAA